MQVHSQINPNLSTTQPTRMTASIKNLKRFGIIILLTGEFYYFYLYRLALYRFYLQQSLLA